MSLGVLEYGFQLALSLGGTILGLATFLLFGFLGWEVTRKGGFYVFAWIYKLVIMMTLAIMLIFGDQLDVFYRSHPPKTSPMLVTLTVLYGLAVAGLGWCLWAVFGKSGAASAIWFVGTVIVSGTFCGYLSPVGIAFGIAVFVSGIVAMLVLNRRYS